MKAKPVFLGCLAGLLSLPAYTQISIDVYMKERGAKIDSLHYGVFFEDINHAADGGLYAELVRNRSFEDCDSIPLYWSLHRSDAAAGMELESNGLLNTDPERYIQFYRAIKEKYPYMQIIGNVDAFDFNPKWRNNHPVDYVDEHYYRNPRWFIDRYRKYDSYDRCGPKVYVGEYAVTKECGANGNLNAALGEAVFMMGMERNSDIVKMNSYAPIFKNENEARWNPDMIHFDSDEVFVTPSYHVQQLFATHVGDYNVKCVETNNSYPVEDTPVKHTVDSVLRLAENPQRYTSVKRFRYSKNEAEIKIYFHHKGDDEYGVWHLGAEHNKRYNLELHRKGEVVTLAYKYNGVLEEGKWYDARIEVRGDSVSCFLNDELTHQVSLYPEQWIYTSASVTADGITGYLKLVNPTDKSVSIDIHFKDAEVKQVKLIRMCSGRGTDENSMEEKELVKPSDMGIFPVSGGKLKLTVPAFSLDIITINGV